MRRPSPAVSIALLVAFVLAACAADEGKRGIADEGMLTAPITLPEPEQVGPAFLLALPPDSADAVETARGLPGAAALATLEVHRIRVRGQ